DDGSGGSESLGRDAIGVASKPVQPTTAQHSPAQGMALHCIVRWRSTRKATMARHKDHVRIAGRLAHFPPCKPDPGTWVRGGGSRCVQSFAYPGGVGWPPHRFRTACPLVHLTSRTYLR
ncbi:hypothetical protein RB213_009815, partial [Colletotrichum asianum]